MGVLTFTPSVPAGTRICARRPSSTASTSIVALSVSISAMTSPALTTSPWFFSHFASLPSVMVGESAGIRISVLISRSPSGLGQHVGIELRRIGLRAGLGEIRRGGDDVLDLAVDVLQHPLVGVAFVQQPLAQMVDGVV